jgi:Domain of unknown function (DUF4145)
VEIVNFPSQNFQKVGARGKCPHCSAMSYFGPVGTAHAEPDGRRICNAAQCQACKEFVLVVANRNQAGNFPFNNLLAVYPLDKPDDRVAEAVPSPIREDFQEALRCRWVKAYRATVTMCRRAIQSSAIALKADGDRLIDQIDDLAEKRIITGPLQRMAHEVRLTGNAGAHPDKDGLNDVDEDDADDIVEFTAEFFHHVYIMPAKLETRARQTKNGNDAAVSI